MTVSFLFQVKIADSGNLAWKKRSEMDLESVNMIRFDFYMKMFFEWFIYNGDEGMFHSALEAMKSVIGERKFPASAAAVANLTSGIDF